MSRDDFELIIKKISPHTKYIFFHVMGEPLLHPLLPNFLDISDSYGLKVNITTNGVLLGERADEIIGKPSLRQLNISLHSFDDNRQSITKSEYMENIFRFIRDTRVYETLVAMRLWNLKDNGQNEQNADFLSMIEKEFSLDYKLADAEFDARGLTIAKNIFLNQGRRFVWPSLENEPVGKRGFCYGLRTHLAVLADGSVVPCCMDSEGILALGNLKEQDLEEIVTSERAAAIYDGFTQKFAVEPLCQRCGYRQRFK
jgi:radical SAM protein with 4Fe4S-binding SPASM domain